MWSKKPTPVARSPSSLAAEDEAHLDLGLAGAAVDLGERGSWLRIVPDAGFHRPGVPLEALGPRQRRGRACQRRAAAPMWTSVKRRRKCPGDSEEAKRAAPPVGRMWLEPAM